MVLLPKWSRKPILADTAPIESAVVLRRPRPSCDCFHPQSSFSERNVLSMKQSSISILILSSIVLFYCLGVWLREFVSSREVIILIMKKSIISHIMMNTMTEATEFSEVSNPLLCFLIL